MDIIRKGSFVFGFCSSQAVKVHGEIKKTLERKKKELKTFNLDSSL